MKNPIKKSVIFIAAGVILSCNDSGNQRGVNNNLRTFDAIEKSGWLIGSWQNNFVKGSATEIWEKSNDSTFSGKSYFIVGVDTVSYETISLEQNENGFFYIPTVRNQNNEQPVIFAMTSMSNDQIIFENPKHDFPQKITYTQITKDSMIAEISGMTEGKMNSQKFPMSRIK